MISPKKVSACLVTKGDVDLDPITASIRAAGVTDIVVWNNADRDADAAVYGRFLAIAEAANDYVYFQDDDVIAPVAEVLAGYKRGDGVFANKPPDESWRFLGVGSVFHRSLADGCFGWYIDAHGYDDEFRRACDVVFAYQHPYRSGWFGYENLPQQTWPNRMYHAPDHMGVRERARERVEQAAVAA